MRLDGVDAVHRHDDTTGSNTVAIAMREEREPDAIRRSASGGWSSADQSVRRKIQSPEFMSLA
jgi:hypothetical protein